MGACYGISLSIYRRRQFDRACLTYNKPFIDKHDLRINRAKLAFKARPRSSIWGLRLYYIPRLCVTEISANSAALHVGYSVSAPVCECTSFVTDDWQRSDSDVHWDASRESRAGIGSTSSQPPRAEVSSRFVRIYVIEAVSRASICRHRVLHAFLPPSHSFLSSLFLTHSLTHSLTRSFHLSFSIPLTSVRTVIVVSVRCSVESGETRRTGEKTGQDRETSHSAEISFIAVRALPSLWTIRWSGHSGKREECMSLVYPVKEGQHSYIRTSSRPNSLLWLFLALLSNNSASPTASPPS